MTVKGNGGQPPTYVRPSERELEAIRVFVQTMSACRVLMVTPPTLRRVNGETYVTGATWTTVMMGIDFGNMLDRLREQVGRRRMLRLTAWAEGEPVHSFGLLEQRQLEDDAEKLRSMAEDYARMFPYG